MRVLCPDIKEWLIIMNVGWFSSAGMWVVGRSNFWAIGPFSHPLRIPFNLWGVVEGDTASFVILYFTLVESWLTNIHDRWVAWKKLLNATNTHKYVWTYIYILHWKTLSVWWTSGLLFFFHSRNDIWGPDFPDPFLLAYSSPTIHFTRPQPTAPHRQQYSGTRIKFWRCVAVHCASWAGMGIEIGAEYLAQKWTNH